MPRNISSPTHLFEIINTKTRNLNGQYTFEGKLSGTITDMDRDIVFLVEAENDAELNQPTVFLEKGTRGISDESLAAMVSFVPTFKLRDQLIELIFLVDRSGSMAGSRIGQARCALELFVHSLPPDCYFNIWSFGSHFDALFQNGSKKYSDDTMKAAIQHVQSIRANYGGTEMYDPLKAIYEQKMPSKNHLRQIFILTDGDVSNSSMVNSLVKQNSQQGRLFSLGVGSSASRYLVKGIARAGGGTAVFATEAEDLRPKVIQQLKNALQPAIHNITISWDDKDLSAIGNGNQEVELETKRTLLGYMKPITVGKREVSDAFNDEIFGQIPRQIPPIFDGSRLLVYHMFEGKSKMPKHVKVTADSPDGPLSAIIDVTDKNILDRGRFVHKLAARKKIQELEECQIYDRYGIAFGDAGAAAMREGAIVELAKEYNICSMHTSFVCVDDKTKIAIDETLMISKAVRNQVPSGVYAFGPGLYVHINVCTYVCILINSYLPVRGEYQHHTFVFILGSSSNWNGCQMQYSHYEQDCAGPSAEISYATLFEDEDWSGSDFECDGAALDSSFCVSNKDTPEEITRNGPEGKKSLLTLDEKMVDLIHLQRSNGMFQISDAIWNETAFCIYAGSFDQVTSACPKDIALEVWLTALAVTIFELKMYEKKKLWELVAEKAKMCF